MHAQRLGMFRITQVLVILVMVFSVTGGASAAQRALPNPRFDVRANTDRVEGWEWTIGETVTLEVGGRTFTEVVKEAPWDPSQSLVEFDLTGVYDIQAEDVVTLSNKTVDTPATVTKTTTVTDLAITSIDVKTDTVSGVASPGSHIDLWASAPPDWHNFYRHVTADHDGNWSANFSVKGSGDDEQETYHIVGDTWVDSQQTEFDEDGDKTMFGQSVPRFAVFPEWEWFDGYGWPDGAEVVITVAGKPECEVTKESWEGFFNGNFGEGCNVVVDDMVTFTDGVTPLTHTVQNLAVTGADAKEDIVTGIADEGATVNVWPHATGEQLQAITDAEGNWQVDFTDVFDLVPNECGRSEIRDVIGNATAVDWCAPKPWLIAFPENEAVEGWEWPDGKTVTLTIDNAPGLEWKGTAQVTTWGDPRTYVRFDFAAAYDLKIGEKVTLTGEDGTTRTHTVQNLSVTDVNADPDTVSGTANAGAVVTLWPHGHDQIATLQTTAGAGNAWSADFGTVGFNLVPGIGGRSEVRDDAGNSTAVDWMVPMLGWKQVNASGFGDSQTTGVSALEVFQGQLYAGASNWNTGGQVWRLGQKGQWLKVSDAGFGSGPANAAVIDLAVFQGQLYAGTGWSGAPGQVWRSADGKKWQAVTTNGFGKAENIAVTNFVLFKDVLYAGTGSASPGASAQIWRSSTGKSGTWKQVAPDGPGLTGNVTGFAVYKNLLYAAVESSLGAPVQVWRSSNGSDWTTVVPDGFGFEHSDWSGGFAQLGGYLYLGTHNEETGAQLWRTKDGIHWAQVVGNGFGDLNNVKIESLLVYDDLLHAVTYNPSMGVQLWRSSNGMNWEQVTANGFGDSGNFSTLWNSATKVYQGQILIGTWNNNEGGELWMSTP